MAAYEISGPVLVSEDTDYRGSRVDYGRLQMLFWRSQSVAVGQPFFLRYQSPPPSLFFDTWAAALPVVEAYSQAFQPPQNQPWFIWRPSTRLVDPEDEYKRFDHNAYFWMLNRVVQQPTELVGTPWVDINDDEWQEQVHRPTDHALALFPFRQPAVVLPGQPWYLWDWRPRTHGRERPEELYPEFRTTYYDLFPYRQIVPPKVYKSIWQETSDVINAGFIVQPSIEWITDPVYPYGAAILGDIIPPEGTPKPPNTLISLRASFGKPGVEDTTTVPNVVGLQQYQAQEAMRIARLVYGTPTYAYNSVQPASYVVSQFPQSQWTADSTLITADTTLYTADGSPGRIVPIGTLINWTVSLGPAPVPVPPVPIP
jgi:hypothetical protein